MAPILSLIVTSLLAARGLAEPFEKLFSVPEGISLPVLIMVNMELIIDRMEA
jgi:hypothetical protein